MLLVMRFADERKVGLREAQKLLRQGQQRFAEVFRHGSLTIELFAPRARDAQQPHARDEAYIVAQGSGVFVNGELRVSFAAGDVLFAAAGESHHFEQFSDDFYTWVLFYGPEGGEAAGDPEWALGE